jgi:hypothetical protein
MKSKDKKRAPKVQGEGDYDAARRHRRDVERFVRQNDTEELAREAKPASPDQAAELEQAEAEGRSRSRDAGSGASGAPADAQERGKKESDRR